MSSGTAGFLRTEVRDHEVASVGRAAPCMQSGCVDRVRVEWACRRLEGLQRVRARGLVREVFGVLEVLVEEVALGGTPISHESLP